MANEMKELHGAVFELTPDMISAVSLDEIEVEDMTPKTRNVKDDTSDKRHRVDDERFGGTVYKLQAWQSATAAVSASVTM